MKLLLGKPREINGGQAAVWQLGPGLQALTSVFCLALSFAGYELLFQPEVVRIYISLLKESKTPAILEASAGAIQNLCAGRWTVSTSENYGF